ncbi:hypothetical protein [Desulfonema ishimotonii]|nr:hypothetical protein [Desulfonema ishimotonii]
MQNIFVNIPGGIIRFLIVPALFLCCGCGNGELPIREIQASLRNVPEYAILLEDMKEEGNFFKDYYHKYRVVRGEAARQTDWLAVPDDYYRANAGFLGMALLSRKSGEMISSAVPPGYLYVGDNRYGQWQADRSGRTFWAFNRGRPLFDELDIDLKLPVYRTDYNTYRKSASRRVPYYGPKHEYGTSGTVTQKKKPTFYQRRMAKAQTANASFGEKVSKRIGRTRTNFRGRSGGRGK